VTATAAGEPLYGREHELQVVAGLVGGLAEGVGGALVVRGEAGIGKSALLAAGAGLAADTGVRVFPRPASKPRLGSRSRGFISCSGWFCP
jgi:ABC-type transport system involved in cytochrome c biogenesis ATPase subunit